MAANSPVEMEGDYLLQPNRDDGQCFRLVRSAPRLSAEPQRVVVQDAADTILVAEPVFESESAEVVVDYEPLTLELGNDIEMVTRRLDFEITPAYKTWEVTPAQFEVRKERFLAVAAHEDFSPCNGEDNNVINAQTHWCAERVAAEYQYVERAGVSQLSAVTPVLVPAEVVALEVSEPKDAANKQQLRAITRSIERKRLLKPASFKREVLLPEFGTITVRQLTRPAALSWAAIACADVDQKRLLKQVQAALNLRGYDVGEPDGEWGAKTAKAVRQFSQDKMLPTLVGDVTLDLLRQLEIPLP